MKDKDISEFSQSVHKNNYRISLVNNGKDSLFDSCNSIIRNRYN